MLRRLDIDDVERPSHAIAFSHRFTADAVGDVVVIAHHACRVDRLAHDNPSSASS